MPPLCRLGRASAFAALLPHFVSLAWCVFLSFRPFAKRGLCGIVRGVMPPILLIALLLFAPVALLAQEAQPSPTPKNVIPLWRSITPGGVYSVALSQIISVSWHEYVVDGAARVTEVNVVSSGPALVRYYYLEPVTPQTPSAVGQSAIDKLHDLAKEATRRVDQEEIWQKVLKTHPGSTHAKTIEYRLADKDDLMRIFASAERAFRLQHDTTVEIKP